MVSFEENIKTLYDQLSILKSFEWEKLKPGVVRRTSNRNSKKQWFYNNLNYLYDVDLSQLNKNNKKNFYKTGWPYIMALNLSFFKVKIKFY